MIVTPKERWRAEHGLDVDGDRKRGASRFRKWEKGILVYEIDSSLCKLSNYKNNTPVFFLKFFPAKKKKNVQISPLRDFFWYIIPYINFA